MRSEAGEDDGGGCARTLSDNVSGSEQEDALAQQTEVKDEIKAVHLHHNEGAGEFQVGVSCQSETGAGVISLQRRKQQKLEEKAVENQTENEVESHVDEAMELQERTRFGW